MMRKLLDKYHPLFDKGGKLQKYYPLYEMVDTFLYSPGEVTTKAPHVRDAIDLKRVMSIVIVALLPCYYMALWNTGYQANLAMQSMNLAPASALYGSVLQGLGLGFDPHSWLSNMVHGGLYLLPVVAVAYLAGGLWECLFALVRKHEINEGFLVTGALIPLIVPPNIPLWQVALATSFGVVVGKELFGGTGKNIFNPALLARVFLFFAYPAQISGNQVWVAADGFSGATPLAMAAEGGMKAVAAHYSWWDCFLGVMPGSMGETSALACLLGAALLLGTGIASWRTMSAVLLGALGLSTMLFVIGSDTNPMFSLSPVWHLVVGGLAFGLVYMAPDPVSSAMTPKGQWWYGGIIGVMIILVRVVNPAYPEGVMLAVLFGNALAPLIDHLVMRANIKRRMVRYG